MSVRDFRTLFIALLFGVSVSAHSQTNLPGALVEKSCRASAPDAMSLVACSDLATAHKTGGRSFT